MRKDVKRRVLKELNRYAKRAQRRGMKVLPVHSMFLESIPSRWTSIKWAKELDSLEKEGLVKYKASGRSRKVGVSITRRGKLWIERNPKKSQRKRKNKK